MLSGYAIGTPAFAQTSIRVEGPVSGIPTSDAYQVSVSTSRNGNYQSAHVHFTEERYTGTKDDYGYVYYLEGYQMSYVNFEFANGSPWVMVRVPGQDVPSLEVRPNSKQAEVYYETDQDGFRIAKIKVHAPSDDFFKTSYLSVVPIINGEQRLDNALGIFANPFLEAPTGNVVRVSPGGAIPSAGSLSAGQTVVFEPGEHNIGINYTIKSGVNYYLANGAYVRGTFNKAGGYSNVRIYGYGILTSTHLKRFANGEKLRYNSLFSTNSSNVVVEGITFEDPAHHALILGSGRAGQNVVKKVKVLGWRANGDGFHMTGRALVQDCFLRTQDDATYIAADMDGVIFERLVTWNDFNGSSFIFTAGGGGKNVTVRNCDVVYNRNRFNVNDPGADKNNQWREHTGGSVFCLRGLLSGEVIENITVEDIRVDDDQIDRAIFWLNMQGSRTGLTNIAFRNITFRNITAPDGGDYPQRLYGYNNTSPQDITFECVTIADQELTSLEGWNTRSLATRQVQISACSEAPASSRSAYQGPHTIPGSLEAEFYDDGEPGVAFQDGTSGKRGNPAYRPNTPVDITDKSNASNGQTVGYIQRGEWLEYTIANVAGGTYDIILTYSSGATPGNVQVALSGTVLGTFDKLENTTGWNAFQTVTLEEIRLEGGTDQVLRLSALGSGFDLDNIEFASAGNARVAQRAGKATDSEVTASYEWFRTYPNPAHEQLVVEGTDDYRLEVYDMTGRQMLRQEHLQGKTSLDIRPLRPGLYLIKLRDGEQRAVQRRIVVE